MEAKVGPLLQHDCIVWQVSYQVNNNQETRVTKSRNYKFHIILDSSTIDYAGEKGLLDIVLI
jgi:hypothetical protein